MFVHDGDQVIAEYENGVLQRRYVYGTYIDEPLAMVKASGPLYYHQNRTYHVMAMTNSSGQLAERYGYTPYGKRRVVSPSGVTLAASAVGNQVGFTGRYHNGETGLTYFRARYLDADLGRFVGRDPIAAADFRRANQGFLTRRPTSLPNTLEYAEGDPLKEQANLFMYVGSDPTNAIDPLGTGKCSIAVGALGILTCTATCGSLTAGVGAVACGVGCSVYFIFVGEQCPSEPPAGTCQTPKPTCDPGVSSCL